MIELLFISHVILLYLAYRLFDRDMVSPSFLFLSGFTICSYIAFCYREEWSLGLHTGTYFLITGGSALFLFVEWIYRNKHPKAYSRFNIENFSRAKLPRIPLWKFIVFAVFQLIIYYFYYRIQMNFSGAAAWAEAVSEIDQDTKFGDKEFSLPWYIKLPYAFCQVSGYVWICLFISYLKQYRKYSNRCLFAGLNMILAICGSLFYGGRMPLMSFLLALVIMLYIVYNKRQGKKRSYKSQAYIIIAVILFGFFFSKIGTFMGRHETESMTANYVLAAYCGAEIKLLDNYINSTEPRSVNENIPCPSTFKQFYMFFVERFHIDIPFKEDKHSFQWEGEYFLGNVYTCYRAFFNDLKYAGFLLVGLMSYLACLLYRQFLQSIYFKKGIVDFRVFMYCFYAMGLILAFFSELFFKRLFFVEYLIRTMIYLYITLYFLYGKNISSKKELQISRS